MRPVLTELAPNSSSLIVLNDSVLRGEQLLQKETRPLVKDFIGFIIDGVVEHAKNVLLEQQYMQSGDDGVLIVTRFSDLLRSLLAKLRLDPEEGKFGTPRPVSCACTNLHLSSYRVLLRA